MKKAFVLLAIIPILLFCVLSCKKNSCNQLELANLKFTPDDTAINPYSGKEILVYKDFIGDSIVFSKGKRETYSFTHYTISIEDANEYHQGCRGDYYTDETNKTNFYTIAGSVVPYLGIEIGFNFPSNDTHSDKYILLQFWPDNTNSGFYGYYLFKNDSLFNYSKKFDTIVSYHKQIQIGTRNFTNIYELYSHNQNTNNQEWFSIAYYSLKEGLCGFRSNSGKIWYLKK